MTTGNYRPPVYMIRIKGHELSEKYAKISRATWEKEGFEVTYIDAITPETMDTFESPKIRFAPKLHLRPNEEKRIESQEKKGFKFHGVFSETEKAVWMSHIKALRDLVKLKEPAIICEHDALVQHMNWDCEHHDFFMMSKNILGAAFYHPTFVKRFLKHTQNEDPFVVRMNPDAYMYDFVNKYLAGKRGRRIRSKTHFIRRLNQYGDENWPVNATKWSESTIEHRLFYDEEQGDIVRWVEGIDKV
jgi:hypothetical protein